MANGIFGDLYLILNYSAAEKRWDGLMTLKAFMMNINVNHPWITDIEI